MTGHAQEVSRGDRFELGANWVRFLSVLNEDRIAQAEQSLREMLGASHLGGGQLFIAIANDRGDRSRPEGRVQYRFVFTLPATSYRS